MAHSGVLLALLVMIVPWRAQAADADDFVTANRTQQARLLEQWAAAPDARRLPLLRALKAETLVADDSGHAFSQQQALGAARTPQGATKPVRLTNRLRNLVAGALATHLLFSDSVTERAAAVKTLQREATPEMAGLLQQRLAVETDEGVKTQLDIALARLQLASPDSARRLAALNSSVTPWIGDSGAADSYTDLQHEPDAACAMRRQTA
ncbi:Urea ABC transporter [Raoultella ornithinolytica]|nr:Urea ABC transporter [Raoultella ornithinolytica]